MSLGAVFGGMRWLALALCAFLLIALLPDLKGKEYVVDENGVRIGGRFRHNVAVRWEQLAAVEVASPPGARFYTFFTDNLDLLRNYALRASDGSVVGITNPRGELGPAAGTAMERAIVEQARRRGIRVVQVDWKAMATWRARKPTQA